MGARVDGAYTIDEVADKDTETTDSRDFGIVVTVPGGERERVPPESLVSPV